MPILKNNIPNIRLIPLDHVTYNFVYNGECTFASSVTSLLPGGDSLTILKIFAQITTANLIMSVLSSLPEWEKISKDTTYDDIQSSVITDENIA